MIAVRVGSEPKKFISRAMYLAWSESGVFGMGAFQDRGDQDEASVFKQMDSGGDYGGIQFGRQQNDFYADYVFGRMMKLNLKISDDGVEFSGNPRFDPEYNSFAHKYPTIKDLFDATEKSLSDSISELKPKE